jgi:hypothetical protein
LHLHGQRLDALPGSHAQKNAGVLDLEPRARATVGNHLKDGDIIGSER